MILYVLGGGPDAVHQGSNPGDAPGVSERNQQRAADSPVVPASDTVLAMLDAELPWLEAAITARITTDPTWRAKAALLGNVPGIGPVATVTVLAHLPDLGTLDRKRVASLTGVAPMIQTSGKTTKPAHIAGGRAVVRTAL